MGARCYTGACLPAAAPISLYHSEPCFFTIFSENPTFGKISKKNRISLRSSNIHYLSFIYSVLKDRQCFLSFSATISAG